MMFPRLQKRGPIEAYVAEGASTWAPLGFHAYKSVAPLKRIPSSNVPARYASFHAYKSVAPLKHDHLVNRALHDQGFHAYKSVAPLKRRLLALPARFPKVSTLTKAWPH